MGNNKKRDKLKKFKITYFTGDCFSSKGEEEKTCTIIARSESEAERDFYAIYRNCSFGWIEEI